MSNYLRTEEAATSWRTFFRSRVQPICCVMTAGWCLIQVWLATSFSACPMNFAWGNELFVWSAARSPTVSYPEEHDLSEQCVNRENRTESFNLPLAKKIVGTSVIASDMKVSINKRDVILNYSCLSFVFIFFRFYTSSSSFFSTCISWWWLAHSLCHH